MIKSAFVGTMFVLTIAGCESASRVRQAYQLVDTTKQELLATKAKLADAQQQLQAERDAIKRLYTEK